MLSGDALGERGIGNAKDLINAVPGLAVTSTGPSSNLSLRGVGSGGGGANTDPTVAFNLDGVNIARQFTTTASFYDLQRVEVLKGPQGTLYGRNATVGAVNVIPNRPSFKSEGSFGLDLGNYRNIGTTGMINVPISDTVAARFAFKTVKRDGFYSNGLNDAKNQAARLGLLFKISPTFSTYFSADYYHDGSKGPSSVFLYPNNTTDRWQDPSNPWLAFTQSPCGTVALCPTYANTSNAAKPAAEVGVRSVVGSDSFTNNDQYVVKNESVANLGFGTLTFIPAFVRSKIHYSSYTSGYQQKVDDDVNQKSAELRLASNGAEKLSWVAGLFYFNEVQDSTFNTLEASGYQILRNPNIENTSYAAFGQSTYAISNSVRLTGGLRYTKEIKDQDGYLTLAGYLCTPAALAVGSVVVAPNPLQPRGGCTVPNVGHLSFQSTDFKAGIEYDLGPDSLLYATVSSGFKAGGFWPGLAPNTYQPEKLRAYSFGSKNRFFSNRVQANVELFYWDYKNQGIGLVSGINPAGVAGRTYNTDGYITGAELGLAWRATSADRFTLDLLLQTGKYKAFPLAAATNIVTSYAEDLPRLNSPHASATASYEHTWYLGNGGSLIANARSHLESSTWLNAGHLPGSARHSYHLSNLSLSYYEPDGKWQVTAYVDNVENVPVVQTGPAGTLSRGVTYRPANNNSMYAALGAPRTYGIRMSTSF